MPHTLTPRGAAKAYAALLIGVLIAGITAWRSVQRDGLSADDYAIIILAVLTPIGVWLAPRNADPPEPDELAAD